MVYFRMMGLGAAALMLAACAGPAPKEAATDASIRGAIRVAEVAVDVSAMGAVTAGRPLPASRVQAQLEEALADALVARGGGNLAAQARVTVDSVDIISASRSMMIGGESVMTGTLSLIAADGGTLLPPTEISAGGGGWVLGGLAGAASLEAPEVELQQLSTVFAQRAAILVFGN